MLGLAHAHVGRWKYEPGQLAPDACVFVLVEPRSDLSAWGCLNKSNRPILCRSAGRNIDITMEGVLEDGMAVRSV
jgi:hypothetical protein